MKNQRAVSFVEIVVSLLLLGIALGAILGAFVIGSVSSARARHRVAAMNMARQKIETIKGTAYSQIPAQAGIEDLIIDSGSAPLGDELAGQRITTVLDIYGNSKMYKVTTVVQWTEHKSAGTLEEKAITLISQH